MGEFSKSAHRRRPAQRLASCVAALAAAAVPLAPGMPTFANSPRNERAQESTTTVAKSLPISAAKLAPGKRETKYTDHARKLRSKPIAFEAIPGWANDDHLAALRAFQASCPKVIGRAQAKRKPTPPLLVAACESALRLPARLKKAEARHFFERYFVAHEVAHKGPPGLATGYYEPVIEGSRKKTATFTTPLYRRPPELITLEGSTNRGTLGQAFTHARMDGGKLMPFATRHEIASGALHGRGLELIYLSDPVEVFFLQVQGSGRIKLTDGREIRVHYDGKNGHPYTSIGRHLIDKGVVPADKMSLGALAKWLRSDLDRAAKIMALNKSYVFFRELPEGSEGPFGALNVPLIPGRSVAVDPAYHTMGAPVFISAPSLKHVTKDKPFNRLMVAHDVGSAIKGPERADIFIGSGVKAGKVAGVIKHPANFIVFVPRTPGIETSSTKTSAAPRQERK